MSRQYNNPFLPGGDGGEGDLSGNIMGYGLTNQTGPAGGMLSMSNIIQNARRMQNIQENVFSSIVLNQNPLNPGNQDIGITELRQIISPLLIPGMGAEGGNILPPGFSQNIQPGGGDVEERDDSDDDDDDDGVDDYTERMVRHLQELTFNRGLGISKKKRVKQEFLESLKERGWKNEVEGEPEKCSVCFEQGKQAVDLPCGHGFHRDCIEPWFKEHATCPICRREFDYEEYEDNAEAGASGGGAAGGPPLPGGANPRIEYADTIANALRNIQFGPQLLGIRELMTAALGNRGGAGGVNEEENLMRREQLEIEAAILASLRDVENGAPRQGSSNAHESSAAGSTSGESESENEREHGQFSDFEDVD